MTASKRHPSSARYLALGVQAVIVKNGAAHKCAAIVVSHIGALAPKDLFTI